MLRIFRTVDQPMELSRSTELHDQPQSLTRGSREGVQNEETFADVFYGRPMSTGDGKRDKEEATAQFSERNALPPSQS